MGNKWIKPQPCIWEAGFIGKSQYLHFAGKPLVTGKAGAPRTQLPVRLLCATLHACVLADPLGQGSCSLMFYRGEGEAQVGQQTSMSPHK